MAERLQPLIPWAGALAAHPALSSRLQCWVTPGCSHPGCHPAPPATSVSTTQLPPSPFCPEHPRCFYSSSSDGVGGLRAQERRQQAGKVVPSIWGGRGGHGSRGEAAEGWWQHAQPGAFPGRARPLPALPGLRQVSQGTTEGGNFKQSRGKTNQPSAAPLPTGPPVYGAVGGRWHKNPA